MYQQHLSYKDMTNYGCFYTPDEFVDILIQMIKQNIESLNDYFFIDTSCGYGAFLSKLSGYDTIGCDIDSKAIEIAKEKNKKSTYFNLNTLSNFSRSSIDLNNSNKIIIVGNPPYNDITSKVKQDLKENVPCDIDDDLRTRDMGISFLLSYNKLKADYVAVLHPLSYMIKKANFELLRPFYSNYTLIDHMVVNSQAFHLTSKISGFPIIIALYKRNLHGMKYRDVLSLEFQTIENQNFNLNKDYIKNYISKYPNRNEKYDSSEDVLFYTMRDINALKRSKTFISEYCDNAIIVDKTKIGYYCYVDAFKDYAFKLPYYLGNLDVFINNRDFTRIESLFILRSLKKHPWLKEKISFMTEFENGDVETQINNYFLDLFNQYV